MQPAASRAELSPFITQPYQPVRSLFSHASQPRLRCFQVDTAAIFSHGSDMISRHCNAPSLSLIFLLRIAGRRRSRIDSQGTISEITVLAVIFGQTIRRGPIFLA